MRIQTLPLLKTTKVASNFPPFAARPDLPCIFRERVGRGVSVSLGGWESGGGHELAISRAFHETLSRRRRSTTPRAELSAPFYASSLPRSHRHRLLLSQSVSHMTKFDCRIRFSNSTRFSFCSHQIESDGPRCSGADPT